MVRLRESSSSIRRGPQLAYHHNQESPNLVLLGAAGHRSETVARGVSGKLDYENWRLFVAEFCSTTLVRGESVELEA